MVFPVMDKRLSRLPSGMHIKRLIKDGIICGLRGRRQDPVIIVVDSDTAPQLCPRWVTRGDGTQRFEGNVSEI